MVSGSDVKQSSVVLRPRANKADNEQWADQHGSSDMYPRNRCQSSKINSVVANKVCLHDCGDKINNEHKVQNRWQNVATIYARKARLRELMKFRDRAKLLPTQHCS